MSKSEKQLLASNDIQWQTKFIEACKGMPRDLAQILAPSIREIAERHSSPELRKQAALLLYAYEIPVDAQALFLVARHDKNWAVRRDAFLKLAERDLLTEFTIKELRELIEKEPEQYNRDAFAKAMDQLKPATIFRTAAPSP